MINSNNIKPKNITTYENFTLYFKDMLTTIFNAKIKNFILTFENKEKFVINTYLKSINEQQSN